MSFVVVLAIIAAGTFAVKPMFQTTKFVGTVMGKEGNTITVARLFFPGNDLKKATTFPQTLEITGATKFAQRILRDRNVVRKEFASSTPKSRATNPIPFFTEITTTSEDVVVGSKIAVTARGSVWPRDALVALMVTILPDSYNVTDPLGISSMPIKK